MTGMLLYKVMLNNLLREASLHATELQCNIEIAVGIDCSWDAVIIQFV